MPRPVGHVPGLAVVKALTSDGGDAAGVQFCEVFMYKGDGQVIFTAAAVSTKTRIVWLPEIAHPDKTELIAYLLKRIITRSWPASGSTMPRTS